MLPIILCTIDIRLSYFIFVTCAIGDAADDDVVPLLSILVQSSLSRTRPIIPNEQLLYSYQTCYLLIFAARFRANRSRTHRALTQSRLPQQIAIVVIMHSSTSIKRLTQITNYVSTVDTSVNNNNGEIVSRSSELVPFIDTQVLIKISNMYFRKWLK